MSSTVHYLPKPEQLEKHDHYRNAYKPNDLYWGIGIEREFYLESSLGAEVTRDWILKNQKPERYSVRYFNSYKPGKFNEAIKNLIQEGQNVRLPMLFNAHALYRMDATGQHQTTYEKEPKPNPKFTGQTLFDHLSRNPFFRREFGKAFCFDGDSIELTTQHFYKCTAQDAIEELKWLSDKWITEANETFRSSGILEKHLPLRWAGANYGLAVMYSNPGSCSIFNNGTYHINLTAPTKLDKDGYIANRREFVFKHKKIIRNFQWLMPFLIAMYGTGDFLGRGKGNFGFAKGSLRVGMSRYIGAGTFNTEEMRNGKRNTIPIEDADVAKPDGWYSLFHQESSYTKLEEIGLDINFNKHHNHGIELRIFDWFPEDRLLELLEILIWTMDNALSHELCEDPRLNRTWNKVMMRAIESGRELIIWHSELEEFKRALHIGLKGFRVEEIWRRYKGAIKSRAGECSRLMLRREKIWCGP
jgi:hypothetical protein